MRKILQVCVFLALLIQANQSRSQIQLSVYAEISIITTDSGDQLYEAFGHSALRLKDPVLNLDLVYNYGVFDFNSPNFYSNFVQGRLLYKLVRYDFSYFLQSYKKQKRWIKQQTLNLSQQEKQAFFMFLEQNALPQNATYLYDPFFDNCASKLIDISKTVLADKIAFVDYEMEKGLSFRTLMNRKIHWNTWGSLGINTALGSKLDTPRKPIEYAYLPSYTYELFKNATIKRNDTIEALVKREVELASFKPVEQSTSILNPFFIFTLIFIASIYTSFFKSKSSIMNRNLDFILLLSTGVLGLFLTFLWFFTNHSTTPYNFNLLWAFPFNIVLAFLILKKRQKKWMGYYIKLLISLLILQVFIWMLQWQVFSFSLIPLLATLFVRYYFLQKMNGFKPIN